VRPDFIYPDRRPPNSPNLKPVDYRVWGILQERVYRKSVKDVLQLKLLLIKAWSGIHQSIIDEVIHQWRVRLNAMSTPKESTMYSLHTCYDVSLYTCQQFLVSFETFISVLLQNFIGLVVLTFKVMTAFH